MALLGLIPDFQGDVQLRMTAQEAKREAAGRALALIGGVVSAVGGIMVLTVNPAFKQQAQGAWKSAPKAVQDNKIAVILGLSLAITGGLYWSLTRKNERRYGL